MKSKVSALCNRILIVYRVLLVVGSVVQPVASDVTALPLPPSSPLVMVTMTNNVNTIQEVSAISPSYAVAHSSVLQERFIQLTQEME